MLPTVAVNAALAPLPAANHAEEVADNGWLVRIPSAQVSSSRAVACPVKAKQDRAARVRRMVLRCFMRVFELLLLWSSDIALCFVTAVKCLLRVLNQKRFNAGYRHCCKGI